MSCLKSPQVKVRGRRLGSEVIRSCLGLTIAVCVEEHSVVKVINPPKVFRG